MGIEKADILPDNGTEICGPELAHLPRKQY